MCGIGPPDQERTVDLILVVTKPFDWCVERQGQTLSRHSSQEAAYKAALDYASALFEEGVRTQVTIKPEPRSFAGVSPE
jgi:hypothetical protein